MEQRTAIQMQQRLTVLRGIFHLHQLTLRQSAELDAIQNYGVKGWNDWLLRNKNRGRV